MYSINDIWTLNILRELRTIGFSMEQIKEHLLSYDLKSTLGLFSDAIDVIDKKTAELSALRAQLSERIDEIKRHQSSDKPKNKITVQYYPERHVLKLSEDVYRDDEIDFVIKKLQSEYEDQLYIIGYGDIGSTIPLEELQEGRYGPVSYTHLIFQLTGWSRQSISSPAATAARYLRYILAASSMDSMFIRSFSVWATLGSVSYTHL